MENKYMWAAVIAIMSGLIISTSKLRTQEAEAVVYAVDCLPSGADIQGADAQLRPYYHIRHTPREGGSCYFRFPKTDVECMSPMEARYRGTSATKPSYASHSGKACYFDTKYQGFINTLRRQPPAGRTEYGGQATSKTWSDVKTNLESAGARLDQVQ